MRLIRFEFGEGDSGWALPGMDFDPGLNLLVGVSGVGKTRILKSLREIGRIARGAKNTLWGAKWTLVFQVDDGKTHTWSAEMEPRPEGLAGAVGQDLEMGRDVRNPPPQPKFLSESLVCDDNMLVERRAEIIKLPGRETPKLSPHESVLSLLQEEDVIRGVSRSFDNVIFADHSVAGAPHPGIPIQLIEQEEAVVRDGTVDGIRRSPIGTSSKLIILQKNYTDSFRKLVNRFVEIFPCVEDVSYQQERGAYSRPIWILKIKERGVRNWIPQSRISSGMYSTWMHLGLKQARFLERSSYL